MFSNLTVTILRLSSVLDRLPKDAPKTVIIHMPLFIENPNEEKASEKNHSMPPKFRNELLQIFQDNNIDFVFSGKNSYILTLNNFLSSLYLYNSFL